MVLLIKFLERLYRTLPLFSTMAQSQEFIEALAAALFPPHDMAVKNGGFRGKDEEEEGESLIEFNDEEVSFT